MGGPQECSRQARRDGHLRKALRSTLPVQTPPWPGSSPTWGTSSHSWRPLTSNSSMRSEVSSMSTSVLVQMLSFWCLIKLCCVKMWGKKYFFLEHHYNFKVNLAPFFALKSEVPCSSMGWWTTFWKQIRPRQCIFSPRSENHMTR